MAAILSSGKAVRSNRQTASVLGTPIDVLTWDGVLFQLNNWSINHESRYVCVCNVHSIVTSFQNENFGRVVKEADMATPDGAPVAWMMRRMGYAGQQRINGPDLMWKYCELAQSRDEAIFLYGSSEETLAKLTDRLLDVFPTLRIAGAISPPFRVLTSEEDATIVAQINSSGAGMVWVSLGCPKQELWMAEHRGRIKAVMVGVGAAFDYHAGSVKRAPKWLQNIGLEWLYRLIAEPKRLWKRYFVTNSFFIVMAAKQLLIRK